jgi:hypothetical protein
MGQSNAAIEDARFIQDLKEGGFFKLLTTFSASLLVLVYKNKLFIPLLIFNKNYDTIYT